MAVGGDLLEISYNHPTLGSGTFFPKANESSTIDSGGFRNEDDDNMIDGGGQSIIKKNRVRWSCECTLANDLNVDRTHEKVVSLANDPVEAVWTISHVSGVTYRGTGMPVGDIKPDLNAGTFTFKIAGSGTLKTL